MSKRYWISFNDSSSYSKLVNKYGVKFVRLAIEKFLIKSSLDPDFLSSVMFEFGDLLTDKDI